MSSVFPSGDGLVLPEGPIDLPALLALPGVVSEETRGGSRGKSVERTVRVAKLPRSRLPDLIIGEERRGNCLLGQRGPERRGNALGRVRLTCSRGQCPRTGKHAELARRAQVRSPCSTRACPHPNLATCPGDSLCRVQGRRGRSAPVAPVMRPHLHLTARRRRAGTCPRG